MFGRYTYADDKIKKTKIKTAKKTSAIAIAKCAKSKIVWLVYIVVSASASSFYVRGLISDYFKWEVFTVIAVNTNSQLFHFLVSQRVILITKI